MASARRKQDAQRIRDKLAARDAEKAAGRNPKSGMSSLSNHVTVGSDGAPSAAKATSALGFEYGSDTAGRQSQFDKEYIPYVAKRCMRWAAEYPALAKCHGHYIPGPGAKLKKTAKLKRFCRKGIPTELRAHVWMEVSGAGKNFISNHGYYDTLVQGQGDKFDEQIRLDIPRTFPNNKLFAKEGSKYQVYLHRMLLAYSNHNKDVGYCQGMNYVAGMLLLVMGGNEEYAFWLFDALVKLLPKGLYNENMLGIQTECSTFVALLTEEFPDIADALKARGALEVMPVITLKWFINCFVDTVPEETVLRVWDILFYDGWKVIYRIGFAILIHVYDSGELLTHDKSSILEFLARIGWSQFDCNKLIETAYDTNDVKQKIPQRRIEAKRKKNTSEPDPVRS